MKQLRVLVLVEAEHEPPETPDGYSEQETIAWRTEYDVREGLRKLRHHVRVLGIRGTVRPIENALRQWRPHVVFNLLLQLRDHFVNESHIVSYLELCRAKYTGCNSRGIFLSQDKYLTNTILARCEIPTPSFQLFRAGRPRGPIPQGYPLIVKPVTEDGSVGISLKSVVGNEKALRRRVELLRRHISADSIAEQYIEGRELTVGILGNRRLEALPIWETFYGDWPPRTPKISTYRLKWDCAYRKRRRVTSGPARGLSRSKRSDITCIAKQAYRALDLTGFGRIDFRMDRDGRVFVIDVNANADVDFREDFARSAQYAGISPPRLLQRILNLALTIDP